jgi:flagellar hook protein FlgE
MTLTDSFSIALSGMQSASAQMSIAASNLAHLNSPGYKAIRQQLMPLPNGAGVAIGPITTDPSAGALLSNGQPASNVDLANEIVEIAKARTLYDANAAVIRSTSQMTGTLLNMFDTDDSS